LTSLLKSKRKLPSSTFFFLASTAHHLGNLIKMAGAAPRTPSPRLLEPLETLQVGRLALKLEDLAANEKWFQPAANTVDFEEFFVYSYPDPSSNSGGERVPIKMPIDVARLLMTNHSI
jgi:hypothetical protein